MTCHIGMDPLPLMSLCCSAGVAQWWISSGTRLSGFLQKGNGQEQIHMSEVTEPKFVNQSYLV